MIALIMSPADETGQIKPDYPRTYRGHPVWRVLMIGIGGLWSIPCVVGAGRILYLAIFGHEGLGLVLVAAVFLLLAGAIMAG